MDNKAVTDQQANCTTKFCIFYSAFQYNFRYFRVILYVFLNLFYYNYGECLLLLESNIS